MVQENYINNTLSARDEVKKLENIAYSADALSNTDLFETSVNMTNWELSPYVAFNTIDAASKCNKKTMIKFPQFLGRTSTMYKNKREKINYDNIKFFGEKETPKVKEKEVKVKEVKVKEVKEKEVKVKEVKVKEVKEKEVKEKEKKPRGRPKKV
jgi:hypothetical protein